MQKILYIDCETTGLNPIKNDILQLAFMIEINDKIVEKHNIFMQPFDYDTIEPQALEVNNLTIQQIKKFPHPRQIYPKLHQIFCKYVDRFQKFQKRRDQ